MIFRFGVVCAAVLCPAAAFAQVIQAPGQPATASYTDTASGLTFPVAVGEFKRFRISRGGPADSISAGYAFITAQARMAATIFADHPPPVEDSCRKMADVDRGVTLHDHPQASLAELVPPPIDGYSATAFSSRYDAPMGGSERYYYCRGGWVVQVHFQHSAAMDAAMLEAAFLRALQPVLAEKH